MTSTSTTTTTTATTTMPTMTTTILLAESPRDSGCFASNENLRDLSSVDSPTTHQLVNKFLVPTSSSSSSSSSPAPAEGGGGGNSSGYGGINDSGYLSGSKASARNSSLGPGNGVNNNINNNNHYTANNNHDNNASGAFNGHQPPAHHHPPLPPPLPDSAPLRSFHPPDGAVVRRSLFGSVLAPEEPLPVTRAMAVGAAAVAAAPDGTVVAPGTALTANQSCTTCNVN